MSELNFFTVIVQHFKHHTWHSIHLHFIEAEAVISEISQNLTFLSNFGWYNPLKKCFNPFLKLYVNALYTWIYMSFTQFLIGVPIINLIIANSRHTLKSQLQHDNMWWRILIGRDRYGVGHGNIPDGMLCWLLKNYFFNFMLESWIENNLIYRKPWKRSPLQTGGGEWTKGTNVAWNVSVIVSVGR